MDMVMVDMAIMDTMVRGLLNLLLPLSPDMVMAIILGMVDMAIMDTMAKGLLMLSQLLLLSQDMDMVMDMAMDIILATGMEDMDITDITVSDLLRPSPVMDIMVMDMVMVMDTDMAMDTMD